MDLKKKKKAQSSYPKVRQLGHPSSSAYPIGSTEASIANASQFKVSCPILFLSLLARDVPQSTPKKLLACKSESTS